MNSRPAKIILAGGSGFLGQTLAHWFASRHWDVAVLTRSPDIAPAGAPGRCVSWDGATIGPWIEELDGAHAVLNLAGRTVNCRYNARNRQDILDSRIASTRIIGQAIQRCAHPPQVWLNASTATIYKHSFDRPMDESGEIGASPEAKDAFSIEVATAWERAAREASTPATRLVLLRTAMVLGPGRNSVFPVLRRLARCGLGGSMAGGRQFVSWIHHRDFSRAIEWLIAHDGIAGAVNVAAPRPLPNREMMRLFRTVCGCRLGLPAPRPLIELGALVLGTEIELIIKSRRVVPRRLHQSGFTFDFPDLEGALRDLAGRMPIRPGRLGAFFQLP